MSERPMP